MNNQYSRDVFWLGIQRVGLKLTINDKVNAPCRQKNNNLKVSFWMMLSDAKTKIKFSINDNGPNL